VRLTFFFVMHGKDFWMSRESGASSSSAPPRSASKAVGPTPAKSHSPIDALMVFIVSHLPIQARDARTCRRFDSWAYLRAADALAVSGSTDSLLGRPTSVVTAAPTPPSARFSLLEVNGKMLAWYVPRTKTLVCSEDSMARRLACEQLKVVREAVCDSSRCMKMKHLVLVSGDDFSQPKSRTRSSTHRR
jgi:hypothetical protein